MRFSQRIFQQGFRTNSGSLLLSITFLLALGVLSPTPVRAQDSLTVWLRRAESLKFTQPGMALRWALLADSVYVQDSSRSMDAQTQFLLGEIFSLNAQIGRSDVLLQAALQRYEQAGDLSGQARCLHRLTVNCHVSNRIAAAKGYEREAIRRWDRAGDIAGLSEGWNGLGNCYFVAPLNLDSALYCYGKSLEYARRSGDSINLCRSSHNYGNTLYEMGQQAVAAEWVQRAIVLADSARLQDYRVLYRSTLASYLIRAGNLEDAAPLLDTAQALAAFGQYSTQIRLAEIQRRYYEARGDIPHAYQMLRVYSDLQKKLLREQAVNLRQDLEAIERMHAQEARIMSQASDLESQQRRMYLWIILFGITLLLALLLLLFYQQRRKYTRLLADSNLELEAHVAQRTRELQATAAELDELFYRASHDLRGPIVRLRGLLEQRSGTAPTLTEAEFMQYTDRTADLLFRLNERLGEIAEMRHHKPAQTPLLLNELLAEVQTLPGAQAQLTLPQQVHIIADARLLRLILRELLRNANAFRQGEAPVQFTAEGNGMRWSIAVSSPGPEIPAALQQRLFGMFMRGSYDETHLGLGLYLARTAATLMGAELHYLRADDRNVFEIRFPAGNTLAG